MPRPTIPTFTEPKPFDPTRPRVYYAGMFRTGKDVHVMSKGSSVSECQIWHRGYDRPIAGHRITCERCLAMVPHLARELDALNLAPKADPSPRAASDAAKGAN